MCIVGKKLDDLLMLVTRQKWKKVQKKLPTLSITDDIKYSIKCCSGCVQGHNLLHLVSRVCPPLSIVQTIHENIPNSVCEADCMKRFPSHVAALHGARPDVIDYLVRANIDGANKCDFEGKSVLHHMFNDYRKKFHTLIKTKQHSNRMQELVSLIYDVAPSTLIAEDKEEMTPLEYAIIEEVDIKTVKRLQKSAAKANQYYHTLRRKERGLIEFKDISHCKEMNILKRPLSKAAVVSQAA